MWFYAFYGLCLQVFTGRNRGGGMATKIIRVLLVLLL